MATFNGVADTLFIPLTARIYISKHFPSYFYDEKSLEIERIIPSSFLTSKSNQYQQFANVSCYYNMDRISKEFIARNGDCNIVSLGCGLETAYWRIASKEATFYELDLPEVIAKRKEILGKGEKEVLLPYSMFDLEWTKAVRKDKPTLLTARGVFEYFEVDEIITFLLELKRILPGAEVVFDCPNSKALGYTNRYVKKTGNQNAAIRFYVDDPSEFAAKCHASLLGHETFFTKTREVVRKGRNLYTKIAMWLVDKKKMGNIIHLRLGGNYGEKI